MTRLVLASAPFLYAAAASAGTLTPVAPFADPYYNQTTLLGINNLGYTTGNVYHENADGTANSLGFLRAPDGTYTTFANPAYPGADFTTGRSLSNSNTVIGYSSTNEPGGGSTDLRGFQRLADGTISLLTRPSDGLVLAGIAQGINDSGTIVGNFRAQVGGAGPLRNHAYLLNGGAFTDLIDLAYPNASTNARGIANNGTVVGWSTDNIQGTRGWVYSGGTFQYVRHPGDADVDGLGTTVLEAINNNGQILGGYTRFVGPDAFPAAFFYDPATNTFTDITIPGAQSVTTWGINDFGRYVVTSDAGNFIYDPAGPVAPDGGSVFAPVDGADVPAGTSQFSITVVDGQVYYIDPAYASGFEYQAGTGPLFSSVIAPAGIGVNNGFSLYLWNGTDYVFDQRILGGVEFDFLNPVDRFQLRGIPASAAIDPNNPAGFITGLTFASAGQFDGFQIAITSVPEPASWALMISGFGLVGASMRRRKRAFA